MSQQLPLGLQLQASARFSNFLAGPNDGLIGQLMQTANGTGASCHLATDQDRTAAYVSLEDISNLSPELLEDWENYQLVCVDDVHRIAGKQSWEEALLNLYNRIRERRGRLFVAA